MSENTEPTTKPKKVTLAYRLYTGDLSYDFIGKRKIWYTVSAVVLIISILGLLLRGLTLGIEFKGGATFQAPATVTSATVDEVRRAVLATNLPDLDSVTVLTIGESSVRVQTRALEPDEVIKVRQALGQHLNVSTDEVAYTFVGASWGSTITKQGAIALVVFMAAVMVLIWIYFRDWKMSVSAIIALLHDLIVTVGVYALVGFTVTPATVIGVLTILGYSLYDTVVVFDKLRENVSDIKTRNITFSEGANLAVNQVLIRSINTTIIGVLPVGALLVAGFGFLSGGPLIDLGLALFVGMIAGAYSSIFIASPLLAGMREREPEMVEHRKRLAKRERKAELARAAAAEMAVELETVPSAPVTSGERRQARNLSRAERKKR